MNLYCNIYVLLIFQISFFIPINNGKVINTDSTYKISVHNARAHKNRNDDRSEIKLFTSSAVKSVDPKLRTLKVSNIINNKIVTRSTSKLIINKNNQSVFNNYYKKPTINKKNNKGTKTNKHHKGAQQKNLRNDAIGKTNQNKTSVTSRTTTIKHHTATYRRSQKLKQHKKKSTDAKLDRKTKNATNLPIKALRRPHNKKGKGIKNDKNNKMVITEKRNKAAKRKRLEHQSGRSSLKSKPSERIADELKSGDNEILNDSFDVDDTRHTINVHKENKEDNKATTASKKRTTLCSTEKPLPHLDPSYVPTSEETFGGQGAQGQENDGSRVEPAGAGDTEENEQLGIFQYYTKNPTGIDPDSSEPTNDPDYSSHTTNEPDDPDPTTCDADDPVTDHTTSDPDELDPTCDPDNPIDEPTTDTRGDEDLGTPHSQNDEESGPGSEMEVRAPDYASGANREDSDGGQAKLSIGKGEDSEETHCNKLKGANSEGSVPHSQNDGESRADSEMEEGGKPKLSSGKGKDPEETHCNKLKGANSEGSVSHGQNDEESGADSEIKVRAPDGASAANSEDSEGGQAKLSSGKRKDSEETHCNKLKGANSEGSVPHSQNDEDSGADREMEGENTKLKSIKMHDSQRQPGSGYYSNYY